ncbi:hypothetical protein [Pseudomonas svalbardensis]|uniref:hypothetical protein n=1 Tax=Pseudomonas svalbardensis TaxID=3042029 RepID=UPI0024B36F55|nr:hypothetical protein [Pseudomonas sp. PMCC200367]
MIIKLSPQRRDDVLGVTKNGDVLTINGEVFDFSPMADGDSLPATAVMSEWFSGQIDKNNGELELALFLPLPANFSQAQAFPQPLLNVPDGPVLFPAPSPVIVTEDTTEERA